MTKYRIESIDQPVYLQSLRYPLQDGKHTGIWTPNADLATRFDSMSAAQLLIFNLENDDPCAVALNLIVTPVKDPLNVEPHDDQLSFRFLRNLE